MKYRESHSEQGGMGHESSHSEEHTHAAQSNGDAIGADASAPFFVVEQFHAAGHISPGSTVGRYHIVREIGVGGMGVVYEAVRDDLQRPVALKTLLSNSRSEHAERLRREAETLARLDHPGIASVLDVFTEGDRFWIVMEFVEGRPMTEASRNRSLRDRLRLFLDVCRAVEHAHLRGVVHRDLKPGNILVNADGRPVVLDFGLARLVEEGADHRVTQTGQFVGTIAYMSPEQASGHESVIDVRSDVYALGVLLYEMLTGELPIDVPTGPLVRAARAIEYASPVAPSQRLPALKGDLDQILLKALAKSPSQRYESAAALAQDIERHLEHRPIEARPPTALYRASRYVRRHRALVFGTGTTILALAIGLVLATTQVIRAREAEQRATERFNDVRELANTVIFDLHDAIKDLPGGTAARAILVESALDYLNRLEKDVGSQPAFRIELAQGYVQLGAALYGYGGVGLGRSEEAHAAFVRALEVLEAHEHDPTWLTTEGIRVLAQAVRGERQSRMNNESGDHIFVTRSPAMNREAALWRRVVDSPEADDADRIALAVNLSGQARYAFALSSAENAMEIFQDAWRTLDSLDDPTTYESRTAKADLASEQGRALRLHDRPGEAIPYLDRSIAGYRELLRRDPDDRRILSRLSSALATRSLAGSSQREPQTEAMADEAVRLARDLCEMDRTDRRAVRRLEVVLAWTGSALMQMAQNTDIATPERRRLYRRSLAMTNEAIELVLQRRERGELPEWENHYPTELAEDIRQTEAALSAIDG